MSVTIVITNKSNNTLSRKNIEHIFIITSVILLLLYLIFDYNLLCEILYI